MFYYKFNLFIQILFGWVQELVKKNFLSPQWLRNIKGKKYPKWRIRYIYFFKKKIFKY